jgi:hypothetical protein
MDEGEDEEEDDAQAFLLRQFAKLSTTNGVEGGLTSFGTSGLEHAMASAAGASHGQMDEEMRKARNRVLVEGMLDLRNPVVTENMVDFLLADGVCELFVGFITQVPEVRPDPAALVGVRPAARPEKGDQLTQEEQKALALSFNAMVLLASDEPTEALMTFLCNKAGAITEAIFEVFQPYSRGSFHHACRVIDHLLRCHTDQVSHAVRHTHTPPRHAYRR